MPEIYVERRARALLSTAAGAGNALRPEMKDVTGSEENDRGVGMPACARIPNEILTTRNRLKIFALAARQPPAVNSLSGFNSRRDN